jgi:hypothetical protein
MQAEAKVGLISGAVGSINPLRSDLDGSLVVVQSGAKYAEAAKNGRLYSAANQAAVAVTAAMATTYTGLVVGNPTTSTKDVVILRFGYTFTIAAPVAATNIGLMTGVGASITSVIATRNRYVGGAAGVATVSNACTLPGTPVLEFVLGNVGTGATSVSTVGAISNYDIDGAIVLPPGAFCAVYSFAANTACAIFSFLWEEVPRIA